MVEKSKINSIQTAKDYNNYDGGGLDDAQKAVFDQPSIEKNADGTPKLIELQEVAETLEKVIKAKKATTYSKSDYDDLNNRKTSHKYAYDAINYNGQYEAALIHLKSKDNPQAPTPGTTEAEIQNEINVLQTSINNFDTEIKKVQAQKKLTENDLSIEITRKFNKEQEIVKINELQERLMNQGTTASTSILPINGKAGIAPLTYNDALGTKTNVNKILFDLVNYARTPEYLTNLIPI
jgi:hypothetical protein